jgi:hypothetical protein
MLQYSANINLLKIDLLKLLLNFSKLIYSRFKTVKHKFNFSCEGLYITKII